MAHDAADRIVREAAPGLLTELLTNSVEPNKTGRDEQVPPHPELRTDSELPCCVEQFVMLRNALKLLGAAGNTAQHETGFRRKPKLARNPHFMGFLLAIPAGLEPATRGVEIRYSR